jgi:hypothetical protein
MVTTREIEAVVVLVPCARKRRERFLRSWLDGKALVGYSHQLHRESALAVVIT